MRLGFASANAPGELPVDVLARELEVRGYESLWVGEHPQIPASRATPYPAGGELPAPYRTMMDPYVALGAAAAVTSNLVLGTAIALPLEHDLLALAKAVATIDHVSGGRLEFGVGVGWNVEELAVHRPDIGWSQRYRAVAEAVAALRVLWTDDEACFEGAYFRFEPVWSFPKPLQAGGPPVIFGGAGPVGVRHTIDWADGWMPLDIGLSRSPAGVAHKLEQFRTAAEDAGRDPGAIAISLQVWGDPELEQLVEYAGLGVHRLILGALRDDWANGASTLAFLDRYTSLNLL